MKIGIDSRFWGIEHAGIGRYVMEMVTGLAKIDAKNEYTIFLRRQYLKQIDLPRNFRKVEAEIKHYSFEEQWFLAEIFKKEKLDLLHVPHFNVPFFYREPFVVTIHDLLWHEVKGLSVTTQNPFIYLLKYLGYRLVVKHALSEAKAILVPSRTIKEKLVQLHKVNSGKIEVIHEAASHIFSSQKKSARIPQKYGLQVPYIIYIGSAYPHKNILKAVGAVKLLNNSGCQLHLVISTSRSVFLNELMKNISKISCSQYVKIFQQISDEDLVSLLGFAKALIQPSLSEGFGLTGLEAMAAGTAVVASDLPIFRELYKDAALYCDPHSSEDIAVKIRCIMQDEKIRALLIDKGLRRAKEFSWNQLAGKTLAMYNKAIGND